MSDEKTEKKVVDFTLPDGREIVFDLDKVTVSEWRAFVKEVTVENEDSIIERCADLEPGSIDKMGMGTWRALSKAFYNRIREPLADPN